MSQVKIKRLFRVVSATVSTATAAATTLRMDDMAGAILEMPTITTNASSIQVWGNDTETGSFCQLYDSSGAVASITLAPSTNNRTAYSLPDAAFAFPYIKLVAANTNATASVNVVFKT
jgi:hypothetical protein